MNKVAAIILENEEGKILLYLRDNKPTIPFPNCWDLFGGHVEEGETAEEALVRELKEELNFNLTAFTFFRKYECPAELNFPNTKYVFAGKINIPIEKITLLEGERPQYFSEEEIHALKFANILKDVVMDYFRSK